MHRRYGIIRLAIRRANYKKFWKRPNNRCTGSASFSGSGSVSLRMHFFCRLKPVLPVKCFWLAGSTRFSVHCPHPDLLPQEEGTSLPTEVGAPSRDRPARLSIPQGRIVAAPLHCTRTRRGDRPVAPTHSQRCRRKPAFPVGCSWCWYFPLRGTHAFACTFPLAPSP